MVLEFDCVFSEEIRSERKPNPKRRNHIELNNIYENIDWDIKFHSQSRVTEGFMKSMRRVPLAGTGEKGGQRRKSYHSICQKGKENEPLLWGR